MKVTYVWEEGGVEKSAEHVCKSVEEAWVIRCGAGAKVKSYTVELVK